MNANDLMDKMMKVIDSAYLDQKPIVERYLSLANRQLNEEFEKTKDWGIIGGSMGLKQRFESKFGYFVPKDIAIQV